MLSFDESLSEIEFDLDTFELQNQTKNLLFDDLSTSEEESYEEKRQVVIDNPKLFNSGKAPIDFYAEKSLTFLRAIELIKKHILSDDPKNNIFIFNRFISLFAKYYPKQYNVISYKKINSSDTMRDYCNTGFIKTQIDIALNKVLGLTIIYDMEEVCKNISHIFAYSNMTQYIKPAFVILYQKGKQKYSALEFPELIEEICNKLNCKKPLI